MSAAMLRDRASGEGPSAHPPTVSPSWMHCVLQHRHCMRYAAPELTCLRCWPLLWRYGDGVLGWVAPR